MSSSCLATNASGRVSQFSAFLLLASTGAIKSSKSLHDMLKISQATLCASLVDDGYLFPESFNLKLNIKTKSKTDQPTSFPAIVQTPIKLMMRPNLTYML